MTVLTSTGKEPTLLTEALEAVEEAKSLVCASDLFRDVAENTLYHEGVDYMVRQGSVSYTHLRERRQG